MMRMGLMLTAGSARGDVELAQRADAAGKILDAKGVKAREVK